MDLNFITQVSRPESRAGIPGFAPGDAYLAGGTWLFSEPQPELTRLVDLTALRWPPLQRTEAGLELAATCTLATLEAFEPPADWLAAEIMRQCCRALLGSFKIRRVATVGGNLCLALPAAPMAALAVALDGVCTIWVPGGAQRVVPASSLIVGASRTILQPGEILRSVLLPAAALRRRAAFRQMSLTPLGRSAALLIGTRTGTRLDLTITAAVSHPIRLCFAAPPSRDALAAAIDSAVPAWLDDVHGRPAWRRRITHGLAAEICAELAPS